LKPPTLTALIPFAANTSVVDFSFTHGAATNQVGFSTQTLQLGRAEYGDQDGILTYEIPVRPIGNVDVLTSK
jgi:hypothetical protein